MNILIIGSDGFLAKNLFFSINLNKDLNIFKVNRNTKKYLLEKYLLKCEIIFCLAGINRPKKNENYRDNIKIIKNICNFLERKKLSKTIVFSSSMQASIKNLYGNSKKECEDLLIKFAKKLKFKLYIFRLPNIFGKWSKPNYNSVVSTFCYNISRKKNIKINNPKKVIKLIYVDEVIKYFLKIIFSNKIQFQKKYFVKINNVNKITLKKLANLILSFSKNRNKLIIDNFSNSFKKNLYSTYVSFLPKKEIFYSLKKNIDSRGVFIEILKSKYFGQVSLFTSKPGISRGFHFHHSKVEKFLVVKGVANFYSQDLVTKKKIKKKLVDQKPEIIESLPGQTHYIKNIGNQELMVVLWSNEIYMKNNPDTYVYEKN